MKQVFFYYYFFPGKIKMAKQSIFHQLCSPGYTMFLSHAFTNQLDTVFSMENVIPGNYTQKKLKAR